VPDQGEAVTDALPGDFGGLFAAGSRLSQQDAVTAARDHPGKGARAS
jgi:hypothetical protein